MNEFPRVQADRQANGDWLVHVHDGEDGSVHTVGSGTAEEAAAYASRKHIEMQPKERQAGLRRAFRDALKFGGEDDVGDRAKGEDG